MGPLANGLFMAYRWGFTVDQKMFPGTKSTFEAYQLPKNSHSDFLLGESFFGLKKNKSPFLKGLLPIGSMYGIFTYIWLTFMVNVGKYTIHGCYGEGSTDGMSCWYWMDQWIDISPRNKGRCFGYVPDT